MSHEIRTPITAVLGISEIQLQNGNLMPEVEDAFVKIHSSSNVLLSVVNDILDLSRIEAGKMTLVYEEYETASMISDVISMNIVSLLDRDVNFIVDVDENLPVRFVGDTLRIAQVMNNLLSNAIKYTMEGEIELRVRYDEDTLIFSIRDTGLGMAQEQIDALYEDYTRFHEDKKRFISGTGLGMPIVYNLVQLMQATIQVKSEVGKGTNVEVKIPQKAAGTAKLGKENVTRLQQSKVAARALANKAKFTPEPMPYGRVLVVDDIDANLYVAQGLLSFYDLDIETCNNGQAAICKIKKGKKYDVIFMDHMMPGLSGIETMHKLREMGYTEPIVVLTANAIIGQAEEFMRQGFDGFISKPILTKSLNAALNKFVRDKQPAEVIEAARNQPRKTKPSLYQSDTELMNKIRIEFASKYRNANAELRRLLADGDTRTAHRLAHSLKSVAGLLHKYELSDTAKTIEYALADGITPTEAQFFALEKELVPVLTEIGVVASPRTADNNKLRSLLNKLKPLLQERNAEAVQLLDELRAIPEATILVKQVEDYDFSAGVKSLDTLMTVFQL